jgi:hypothetical protein
MNRIIIIINIIYYLYICIHSFKFVFIELKRLFLVLMFHFKISCENKSYNKLYFDINY